MCYFWSVIRNFIAYSRKIGVNHMKNPQNKLIVLIILLSITNCSISQTTEKVPTLYFLEDNYVSDVVVPKWKAINKQSQKYKLNKDINSYLINLDKKAPSFFVIEAGKLLKKKELDNACMVHLVGKVRRTYYYNSFANMLTNNDVFIETNYNYIDKIVNIYLKKNIDYYITAYQEAINYCTKNDYTFYKKEKDIEVYTATIKFFQDDLNEVIKNKSETSIRWKEEIKNEIQGE